METAVWYLWLLLLFAVAMLGISRPAYPLKGDSDANTP